MVDGDGVRLAAAAATDPPPSSSSTPAIHRSATSLSSTVVTKMTGPAAVAPTGMQQHPPELQHPQQSNLIATNTTTTTGTNNNHDGNNYLNSIIIPSINNNAFKYGMRSRGSPLREEETESRTKQTAAPNNSNNNNNNIGTILFPNKNNNNNNRLINDNTNNNNNVITFDSINNNNNSNNSSRVRYPSSHLFATNSHFPDKHIYSSYTTTKNYNSNNSNVTNNDYVAMEIANDSTNTNLPPIVDLYPTNNNNTNHNFCVHDKNHDSFMENDDKNTTNNDDDDDDCSVETQDGIHDIPGFWCVCLVILIGDMSRGVFFPSLWPLVECLGNNNGNNNNNNNGKVWLGYAVAAFSLGRILVNPLFGSWSHKYGYSPTLLFSCAILLVGTLMYAQVQTVAGIPLYNSNDQNDNAAATAGTRGLYYLILSQTVMGIGSGTLGVTRAFVADVTARRHRTKYMGWITAVQYGGFTVTPAFGALFNVLLANNREYTTGQNMLTPFVRINMYTAPAYFMASVVLLTIAVLLVIFRDRHRAESVGSSNGKKSQKRQTIDQVANQPVYFLGSLDFCLGSLSGCYLTVYDCCILGCMLLNIATKGSIASFETLGIAIAEEYFAMVASRAGIIIACCGVCGVIALLNLGYLEQSYSDVNIIMGGMFVMMVGIASLTLIEDSNMNNPNWAYTLAMFLIYAIGYPVGHTAVIGLFSKIVGRRPQGELLGWFASAGSLARIIFPILSGYIASFSSMEMVFAMLIGVLLMSAAFLLWARQTLTLLSS